MLAYRPSIGHTPSSHNHPPRLVQVLLFYLLQTLSPLHRIDQRGNEKKVTNKIRSHHVIPMEKGKWPTRKSSPFQHPRLPSLRGTACLSFLPHSKPSPPRGTTRWAASHPPVERFPMAGPI